MSQFMYGEKPQKIEEKSVAKLLLEVNTLRQIQKKMEEIQRSMTYARWKFNEFGISSDIPAQMLLDLIKINSLVKKEEEKRKWD